MDNVTTATDPKRGRHRVLYNDRDRLVLVFDTPQRAVGLEYGYWPVPQSEIPIHVQAATIVAYDRDGAEIARGSGVHLERGIVQEGRVAHRVGVRARPGHISSVEVFFTFYDPGAPEAERLPVAEPLVVHRVWHEALPPAATHQAAAEVGGDPEATWVTLPFRCNRAVVFFRGFRLAFTEGEGRPIRGMHAGIEITPESNPGTEHTPDPADRYRTRTVQLRPRGRFLTGEDTASECTVFYTLFAWDADQVELSTAAGSDLFDAENLWAAEIQRRGGGFGGPERFSNSFVETGSVVIEHPGARLPPDEGQLKRGAPWQVFGGLQSFFFQFGEHADAGGRREFEIEALRLAVGPPRSGMVDGRMTVTVPLYFSVVPNDPVWRAGEEIIATSFGPSASYDVLPTPGAWSATCVVVCGPSLHPSLGASGEPFVFAIPSVEGPRDNDEFLSAPLPLSVAGITVQAAEQLCVGLQTAYLEPGGPVAELELEVKAQDYVYAGPAVPQLNGVGNWQYAAGMRVEGNDQAAMWGVPMGFGVLRKALWAHALLTTQDMVFEGVTGTLSMAPIQFGLIRNVGTAPVLILGAELVPARGGPAFFLRFAAPPWTYPVSPHIFPDLQNMGETFTLDEMTRRPPVRLEPGQSLIIGGTFFPQADGRYEAFLNLHTNAQPALVQIRIAAGTLPNRAHAIFIPDPTNFGNVRVGTSPVRDALIASDGQSPVIVSQVGLQDATLGFRLLNPFGGFQLSPGESRLISIEFAPGESGRVQTRLFAMTNVPGQARMEIQVMGNGEFAE